MKPAAVPDNYLLQLLDSDARASLSLRPVQLSAGDVLHEPGMPVLSAYFPVSAVLSLVATMESGASAEVALVGREGLVGLAGVLGTVESPTTSVVQISGMAFKAPTAVVQAARLRFASVRTVLDRYTEVCLIQVAQTAACNRLHSVEARLARWLLTLDDRIEGEPFTLSHEFMARMLGVRRPTLSTTIHRFQAAKAIAHRGRSIVVADRSKLERVACECYGVLRREFERLRRSAIDEMDMPSQTIAAAAVSDSRRRPSAATLESMREIAGRLLLANMREQEAREDAEAANRAKDQFLAMVSHELRTPLNAILGWCAILAGPSQEPIDRGLHVIQQNATAQLTLVEDLLDAVRLASSTLVIQPTVINLGEVIQDALDAARPIAAEKQVVLRLAIADDLSPILADADRLRQVFQNVVTNAVKFTDSGGLVDVSVTTAERTIQVTIRDTGRGIAPEVLPHVFERFRQGSPPAVGSHGLGLGLTIAQTLVELHGGRIQMASPGEGLGTTCTIDLPMRANSSSLRWPRGANEGVGNPGNPFAPEG